MRFKGIEAPYGSVDAFGNVESYQSKKTDDSLKIINDRIASLSSQLAFLILELSINNSKTVQSEEEKKRLELIAKEIDSISIALDEAKSLKASISTSSNVKDQKSHLIMADTLFSQNYSGKRFRMGDERDIYVENCYKSVDEFMKILDREMEALLMQGHDEFDAIVNGDFEEVSADWDDDLGEESKGRSI